MVTNIESLTEREAASYLTSLFNANILPMIVWRFDGTFIMVNDAYLKMLGFTRQDYENDLVNWRKITPQEYEEADAVCTNELKTKGQSTPFIKEFIRKDGSRVRAQVNNVMLHKTDDHGLGIFLKA